MSLTLTNPTLGPGVVDPAKITENFTAVAAKFGNIDNSDVKAGAGISIDKLSASYEYMVVRLTLTDGTSTDNIDVCPIYNDGKGDWTVVATQWATQDNGDPSAVITIGWGTYDGGAASATPSLTTVSTIDTITLTGTANTQTQGSDASPSVTSLASGTNRFLYAKISTADADAAQKIYVSVHLKRQIAT